LTAIRKGSTITQDRDLARVFSHRPTLVSISHDAGIDRIRHDGTVPGFLYRIAEDLRPGDVYPHPHSSMGAGKEWLTSRELRVILVGPTEIVEQERLTQKEIEALRTMLQMRDG
ncbi:unnamed protein product, partial [marine sediment metagenome]